MMVGGTVTGIPCVRRLVAAALLGVLVLEGLFKPVSRAAAGFAGAIGLEVAPTIHDVILLLVLLLICIGPARWTKWLSGPLFRGFLSGALLATPFVATIWFLLWISGNLSEFQASIPVYRFWLLALGSALYVALAEELLLRGALQGYLEHKFSARTTIWLQGITFSALHFPGYQLDIFQAAYFFAAGMLLTLIYLRWRSVWTAAGVHCLWNTSAFALYGFSVRGNYVVGVVPSEHFGVIAFLFSVAVVVALVTLATSNRMLQILNDSSVALTR